MYEKFKVLGSEEYLSRRSLLTSIGWSVVGATAATVMLGYRPRPALAQVPATDPRVPALKGTGTATIADPGGALTKGLAVALYEPFRKYTGIDVKQLAREAEPIATVKSMVEAKSVFWDSTTLTSQARLVLSPLGLLEPLKWDSLPFAKAELLPEAVAPDWIGNWLFAAVLSYRTDRFASGKEPKSWADFFDVKGFPGRRAMWKNPVWTLEEALVADGVAPKDLYPLDVARAFKKLDTIKRNINVWYTGGAQATQLIQSGEVDLMAIWNTRAQGAIDSKAPVAIEWNQAFSGVEGFAIPKGAPNAENAQKFICFSSWAENQAAWTAYTSIAPTNRNAFQFVPKERFSSLATAPGNAERLIATDFNWWAKNLSAVQEKFDEWLLT
jgi:putative spermidine/putrescine transport system substrate-binding protein